GGVARARGVWPWSPAVARAGVLVAGALLLAWWGGAWLARSEAWLAGVWSASVEVDPSGERGAAERALGLLGEGLGLVVLIGLVLAGVSLAARVCQAGVGVRGGALAPRLSRLRLGGEVSTGGAARRWCRWCVLHGLAVVVGAAALWVLLEGWPSDWRGEAAGASARTALVALLVALDLGVGGWSAADWAWRRRAFRRGLRMTRAEVRAEQAEQSVPPEAARRRARRRRSSRRGDRVTSSDVVVFAPGGSWVVLRYRPGVDAAPVVWARVSAEGSSGLRDEAAWCGAALACDPGLVGRLSRCPVGRAAPAELYSALGSLWRRVGRA
ncbi:MAG: EscU/YscU/HrcU family type III secretion system export apparatus switch protein, partial [Planctomycetota bacterium]